MEPTNQLKSAYETKPKIAEKKIDGILKLIEKRIVPSLYFSYYSSL